jgi:hypothetical protein
MHILKLMWRAVTSFVLTKKEKKKKKFPSIWIILDGEDLF